MKTRFIIFLVFTVFQTVESQSKLVVNTTCLELAKPSNQHFRTACSNSTKYHCLLDETFTKEFEVCKEWKWISKGHCAYFNTYREGNIDQKQCINSTSLVCPESAYFSKDNTNYPACYVKNTTSTISPKTSSFEVTLEGTTEVTSDVGNFTASPISDDADNESGITGQEGLMRIAIVFGVIIPLLLPLAVIYIICQKRVIDALRYELERADENVESQVHHQENENGSTRENEVNNGASQRQDSENDSDEEAEPPEHQQLIRNKPFLAGKNDDKEKEPSTEDPAHLCSRPVQLDTKDEDKETIVKPDEKRCTALTLDDANLPQNVSAAVSAKEPGKTVTA